MTAMTMTVDIRAAAEAESDYRFVCKGRFEHNWYTRRFGGVYCTRCSLKAERSCVVNGKRVGYHCEENK